MNPAYDEAGVTIYQGDCREVMRSLSEQSVRCCVTSPPYFGLRDYGVDGQIGLEPTPDEFVAAMVAVFRSVKRVLRDDGTVWLNLGDSYAASQSNNGGYSEKSTLAGFTNPNTKGRQANSATKPIRIKHGLKPKDLIGIPWRVAFALQADGWYLRQDIIWHKPNPMPESVQDRCTKAHEYIFLLSKSPRYYYDAEAVAEPAVVGDNDSRFDTGKTAIHQGERMQQGPRFGGSKYGDSDDPKHRNKSGNVYVPNGTRNPRSVWSITTKPFKGAHFATFPPELPERCIKAGSAEGDIVLDPFTGSGTTADVARKWGRRFVGAELNPDYIEIAKKRLEQIPLFGAA